MEKKTEKVIRNLNEADLFKTKRCIHPTVRQKKSQNGGSFDTFKTLVSQEHFTIYLL